MTGFNKLNLSLNALISQLIDTIVIAVSNNFSATSLNLHKFLVGARCIRNLQS